MPHQRHNDQVGRIAAQTPLKFHPGPIYELNKKIKYYISTIYSTHKWDQGEILVGFGRRYAQPGRCAADAAFMQMYDEVLCN